MPKSEDGLRKIYADEKHLVITVNELNSRLGKAYEQGVEAGKKTANKHIVNLLADVLNNWEEVRKYFDGTITKE